jgi:uncharacterized RDD family membrane protein YckC
MSTLFAASVLRRLLLSALASLLIVLVFAGLESLPSNWTRGLGFEHSAADRPKVGDAELDLNAAVRRLREELDAERLRQAGPEVGHSSIGMNSQAERLGHVIGPYLPAFITLALALFIFWDMALRTILEPSIGWRRLSFVVAFAAGAAVFGFWIKDGESDTSSFLAGLSGLGATFAIMLYGRAIFLWVAEGFRSSPERPLLAPAGASNPMATQAPAAFIEPEPVPSPTVTERSPKGPPSEIVSWRTSSFWPRFWARCFDLPVCWALGSILAGFLPDYGATFDGSMGVMIDLLSGMVVICLFIFVYEAFFTTKFGATPGKKLLGLQVRSIDDRHPNWADAVTRARVYLWSGLYFLFFLPVLQIFSALIAWRRANQAHPWDKAARTYVRQKPIGFLRQTFAICIAVLLSMGMVGSLKLIKEDTQDRIFNSNVTTPSPNR